MGLFGAQASVWVVANVDGAICHALFSFRMSHSDVWRCANELSSGSKCPLKCILYCKCPFAGKFTATRSCKENCCTVKIDTARSSNDLVGIRLCK